MGVFKSPAFTNLYSLARPSVATHRVWLTQQPSTVNACATPVASRHVADAARDGYQFVGEGCVDARPQASRHSQQPRNVWHAAANDNAVAAPRVAGHWWRRAPEAAVANAEALAADGVRCCVEELQRRVLELSEEIPKGNVAAYFSTFLRILTPPLFERLSGAMMQVTGRRAGQHGGKSGAVVSLGASDVVAPPATSASLSPRPAATEARVRDGLARLAVLHAEHIRTGAQWPRDWIWREVVDASERALHRSLSMRWNIFIRALTPDEHAQLEESLAAMVLPALPPLVDAVQTLHESLSTEEIGDATAVTEIIARLRTLNQIVTDRWPLMDLHCQALLAEIVATTVSVRSAMHAPPYRQLFRAVLIQRLRDLAVRFSLTVVVPKTIFTVDLRLSLQDLAVVARDAIAAAPTMAPQPSENFLLTLRTLQSHLATTRHRSWRASAVLLERHQELESLARVSPIFATLHYVVHYLIHEYSPTLLFEHHDLADELSIAPLPPRLVVKPPVVVRTKAPSPVVSPHETAVQEILAEFALWDSAYLDVGHTVPRAARQLITRGALDDTREWLRELLTAARTALRVRCPAATENILIPQLGTLLMAVADLLAQPTNAQKCLTAFDVADVVEQHLSHLVNEVIAEMIRINTARVSGRARLCDFFRERYRDATHWDAALLAEVRALTAAWCGTAVADDVCLVNFLVGDAYQDIAQRAGAPTGFQIQVARRMAWLVRNAQLPMQAVTAEYKKLLAQWHARDPQMILAILSAATQQARLRFRAVPGASADEHRVRQARACTLLLQQPWAQEDDPAQVPVKIAEAIVLLRRTRRHEKDARATFRRGQRRQPPVSMPAAAVAAAPVNTLSPAYQAIFEAALQALPPTSVPIAKNRAGVVRTELLRRIREGKLPTVPTPATAAAVQSLAEALDAWLRNA